jgi:hypothetical protein
MSKVYILLEKDLETEQVRVEGVYETYKDAQKEFHYLMDFNEEVKSYKIVEKEIQ